MDIGRFYQENIMTVAEYVMDFIAKKGVKDVFTVAGGGSMYLLEAMSKKLNYTCNHHEQAASMAAEAYARVSKNFGVCLVSTGPAATNALTGVACAWNDSIPVMYISGQAKSDHLIGHTLMRQRGVHEVNIVKIVSPITKYAECILDPKDAIFILNTAYEIMMHGRKGPVWIDIPLDIQNSEIEPHELEKPEIIDDEIDDLTDLINDMNDSKRPVILIGAGSLGCLEKVISFATKHNIAMVSTKNAYGYIPANTKGYLGMAGVYGNRKANVALQEFDYLLVLGARLPYSATGYNVKEYAPNAKKYIVEIDVAQELNWEKVYCDDVISFDGIIFDDVNDIIDALIKASVSIKDNYADKYLTIEDLPDLKQDTYYVNSYSFYKELSKYDIPILITDQGAAFYSWSQAYKVRDGISFTNGGFSPMGYGLPAAIGAHRASNKPVVLVTGDGGLEMNLQELQTILHYNMPITIYVFENKGYGSIKNTQDAFFNGHYVGSDPMSGVTCVNIEKIANAYDIRYHIINNDAELWKIKDIDMSIKNIIEVKLDPHQKIIPKVMHAIKDGKITPGNLGNMYPYTKE
jgi:acetolactate synthase-1/2/3 large subunit